MRFKLLIILIILLGSNGLAIAKVETNAKKNILDYLRLLPKLDGFYLHEALRNENNKFDVKDTKNGYVRITGDFEGFIEASLFRKKNGSPILIVGETFCGPVCGTDLFIFGDQKGKMVRLPNGIIPQGNADEIDRILKEKTSNSEAEMLGSTYKLPRYGTTIKYFDDESNVLIYKINWKNDKFVIDRSVLDLYRLFPNNWLSNEFKDSAEMRINDEKNGYLLFSVDITTIEVGLFRMKDYTPVLVFSERYTKNGKSIHKGIDAYQYRNQKWINLTKKILPNTKEIEKKVYKKNKEVATYGYEYSIPRKGTTIRIIGGSADETIYKLIWKNDRFVLK